eukprot:TRINITY_DN7121_c0_g1_i1.p1 TRINITY_DN7121_c0_g1~~TRINITY_DN7121_c0_g1_i1.p1  ORF type:complete len:708 (-),score=188.83 TRINITY_DN7121_c0_g1_i1:377-2500(-)
MANVIKRKIETSQGSVDVLEVMPIGAGNEVGRSCVLMRFKGKTVMFDCGIHPAYSGLMALPYFDTIQPANVDLLLVSHFHLDHCAALPYFMQKTGFRGRVFATHATKAITKMLLGDYVKVATIGADEMLYDELDVARSLERLETCDYHQQLQPVSGIKFTAYNAGHVLGAAMFVVEIAGVRVLYTGDFSRQEDRHLMAAEIPPEVPHVLIVESTYGVQIHQPRDERERRFTGFVHDTVRRGGRCLIPVFALGRAQELLLILDEYWQQHPELHHVPVYYASSLAKKCMSVYQTYIGMMNEHIRARFAVSNPFVFKHISNLKSMEHFDDVGPCVVMASPGMLQSGLSRELFERWCPDARNGVIIPGYCVDGTLAHQILQQPKTVTALHSGQPLPLNCQVAYVSFSAHSDFVQTSQFIEAMQPLANVVLVHGEATEMGRLAAALQHKYGAAMRVMTPKNGHRERMEFAQESLAKAVGTLANDPPTTDDASVSAVLVSKEYTMSLVHGPQVPLFTTLHTSRLEQLVSVPLGGGRSVWGRAVELLSRMYDDLKQPNPDQLLIGPGPDSEVRVLLRPRAVGPRKGEMSWEACVQWHAEPTADMVADSVLAVLAAALISPLPQAKGLPVSVGHGAAAVLSSAVGEWLGAEAAVQDENPAGAASLTISLDGGNASCNLKTNKCDGSTETCARLRNAVAGLRQAVLPVAWEVHDEP